MSLSLQCSWRAPFFFSEEVKVATLPVTQAEHDHRVDSGGIILTIRLFSFSFKILLMWISR